MKKILQVLLDENKYNLFSIFKKNKYIYMNIDDIIYKKKYLKYKTKYLVLKNNLNNQDNDYDDLS